VDGVVNSRTHTDRWLDASSWAFPWKGMLDIADGRALPRVTATSGRIDCFRFEKLGPPPRNSRTLRRVDLEPARPLRFPHPRTLPLCDFSEELRDLELERAALLSLSREDRTADPSGFVMIPRPIRRRIRRDGAWLA